MSDATASVLDPESGPTQRRPDLRIVTRAANRGRGARHLPDGPPAATAAVDRLADDPLTHDPLADDVAAARSGDHTAFERLVEATHRETYSLALHLTGCPEDARDVTQEAYLRAYRGLDGFRSDSRFSTWMYRITANAAVTHTGRTRRHRHDELRDDAPIVDTHSEHDPALVADAGDLRDQLIAALGTLPPRLRAVVVLRDVYELSHEAIAEELGISVSAAKVRLHRARHRLRLEVFTDDRSVPAPRTVSRAL